MGKNLLKSKTFWFAVVKGIAGIVAVVQLENPTIGGLAIASSIIDVILRFLTSEPITKL